MSGLKTKREEFRVELGSFDENPFCEISEKEDEDRYLYMKKCENLHDLKVGWKPDSVRSRYGILGSLYDLPGRTVFRKIRPSETDRFTTDSEWKKLRAPWRHYMAFFSVWGPPGNLLYNIRVPLSVISIIIIANAVYGTCREIVNPNLPLWFAGEGSRSSAYDVTSFLVSLLLGFKINRSFDRWWLARQNFTNVCARLSGILTSVSLEKLKKDPLTEEERGRLDRVQRLLLSVPSSIIMTLYSLDKCPLKIRHILDKDEIQWIENTKEAWYFLLCKLQVLICSLTTVKSADLEKEVYQLRMDINSMFAIKRTNIPYFLSKIPTALIMVYTVITPFNLFESIMLYIEKTEDLQGKTVRNILHYWYLASLLFVLSSLIIAANEAADLLEDPYYYIPINHIAQHELGKASRLIQLVDPESDLYYTFYPQNSEDSEGDDTEKADEEVLGSQSMRTSSWFFKE